MKRPPLLVDEVLAGGIKPDFYTPKFIESMQARLRVAKRFVLDEDAARHLGNVADQAPEAIAYAQEFALRPFDRMYVEFPFAPVWEMVTHTMPDKINGDATLGYLYDGPRVYIFTRGYAAGVKKYNVPYVAFLPLYYHLNKPFTIPDEQIVCDKLGISRTQLDAFFWGQSINKLDPDAVRLFRAEHSFGMLDGKGKELQPNALDWHATKIFQRIGVETSSGDLRNIIAMLLLLNQPSQNVYLTDVAPMRRMLHNKAHTYVSHSVVKLNIDPVPRLKKMLIGAEGVWRKEHDVRGHFCHNEEARNAFCDPHDWTEYDVNQWRCLKCAGLRWWRKEHRRGHKEKGKVKTSYQVTA
jgi:hypothetical protein